MPRNMSFSLTTDQVRNHSKTVTRRNGWWFLKQGDVVNAVEKGMGLKKGEKIKRICQIRIIDTREEELWQISYKDLAREGFSDMPVAEFIKMFCKSHKGCLPHHKINRIEFEYV